MKTILRLITAGVSCYLLMAVVAEVSATSITYSWTGFVAPTGDSDPLLLSRAPTPFTLEATISGTSPLITRHAGFAAFDLSGFRLVVGGREFSIRGTASINFTDKETIFEGKYAGLGLPDSMDVVAEVSYGDADWQFLSVVPISSDTFFFPTETSLPPLFPPIEAIDEGSSSLSVPNAFGGFDVVYWGLGRAPRVTATVVPEPATLLLATASFFACLAIRRWRRDS